MSYPTIVLFGDSITEYSFQQGGLSCRLNETYARKVDILTKGFAGYNTRWAKPLLKPVLDIPAAGIEAVVIFLGTNDAAIDAPQTVPIDEYKSNLAEMVALAKKYTKRIVIVGPTLVDERGTHEGCAIRQNRVNLDYNRAALEVATAQATEFIDLWTLFRQRIGDNGSPLPGEADYKGPKQVSLLVDDGIHFTAEAYGIWYDALTAVFEKLEIAPSDFGYVYPSWREVAAGAPVSKSA